ncbi:acyl-CoA dehydrogenase family protein [uncultured Ramlibacter sp.]|uniref:acyl-CoA dehydrogenase family protein n=1 Tax=uncultured Ramlibacter sp. TaxID=260755 RepID=UPI0026279B3C|nr:acyl-CoA dehydrogenase family protein [uncultured Ramlibacter sp.]
MADFSSGAPGAAGQGAQHGPGHVPDDLLARLDGSAAERDRQGGHAAQAKEWIRAAGLLTLTIPARFGGGGASWPQALATVRRLAQVDSAMAHLLAFQYLQLSGVQSYGTPEQVAHWFGQTVLHRWWWGNAANPADPRLAIRADGEGWRLDGVKGFCSGTRGSDVVLTSAVLAESGQRLFAVLPTARQGITVNEDWDPVGQRQTDSGSVQFDQVRVEPHELLRPPPGEPTPFLSLRGLVAQLVLVTLYIGIAEGALRQARGYTLHEARPWHAAGVSRAADDPYIIHRYAEMDVAIAAADAVARQAIAGLEQAWQQGAALQAAQRGALAVEVARAKVLAHRAALATGEGVFDVAGARATRASLGLDRFWRNARTHTLHDPVDYKLRDIGRHALEGVFPPASLYS